MFHFGRNDSKRYSEEKYKKIKIKLYYRRFCFTANEKIDAPVGNRILSNLLTDSIYEKNILLEKGNSDQNGVLGQRATYFAFKK